MNWRSARARRFRDLVRAHLDGIDDPDAGAIALARSAALASLKVESLQARILSDEDVDDAMFARLCDSHGRALRRLAMLKATAQAKQAKAQPPAQGASSAASTLAAYLTAMKAREQAKRAQRGSPGAATGGAKPSEG
jgi:hypothetical protein